MSCWIAIPIKSPDACKTRLRAALDDGERERLVRAMLQHVAAIAKDAMGDNRLLLLAPAGHSVSAAFERIPDKGRGLNGELAGLLDDAITSAADRLVIVPADLPLIAKADIDALIDLQRGYAAIASDRARLGTNALSLPLPAAQGFRFQFGPGSFERHSAEASRLSLPLTVLQSERLAFDIDEPADLADFRKHHAVGEQRSRDRHLEMGGVVGSK